MSDNETIILSEYKHDPSSNAEDRNMVIVEYMLGNLVKSSYPKNSRSAFQEIVAKFYEENPSIFKEIFAYEDKKEGANKWKMWSADSESKLFRSSRKVSGDMHMDDVYIEVYGSTYEFIKRIADLVEDYRKKNALFGIEEKDIIFHLENRPKEKTPKV